MTGGLSRVTHARALKGIWFGNEGFATAINTALDEVGFTQDYVTSSIQRKAAGITKPKAIKDGVWGMMEFEPAAMRLIDSPLMQRLRRIHQLGFSYLTYPSAEHSRFIHCLGMAHVVSRFVGAIERDRKLEPDTTSGVEGYRNMAALKPLTSEDLIHASLVHDIGHLPFSHAAERAVVDGRDRFKFGGLSYDDFQGRAEQRLKTDISLSETLSIAIILSDRFSNFYSNYVLETPDPEAVYRIACLIAGQRVLESCGNIQDIISSSSVDADKIDYVSRDALACGIPIGVDVSRVFLGSAVLGITSKLAEELGYTSDDRFVFALNASGWDTFDEIIRARSTLYQRVYLHAVTRTAEAVFSRALKLNAEWANKLRRTRQLPAQVQLADAVALWGKTDDGVIDLLSKAPSPTVAALGASLRDRHLPKKACVLSQDTLRLQVPIQELLPEYMGGSEWARRQRAILEDVGAELRRLDRANTDLIDSVSFEDEILLETRRLYELIKDLGEVPNPTTPLNQVVFIPIAGLEEKKSDAPVFQHGELLTADTFTNVRGATDATDFFRAVGYIMSSAEWREFVLVATQTVLYRRSQTFKTREVFAQRSSEAPTPDQDDRLYMTIRPLSLSNLEAVVRRVGVSRSKLKAIQVAAEEAGYFDEIPVLLRRRPDVKVRDAATRYRTFDGERGWRVEPETVAAFVDQTPPRLREALIDALRRGQYLSQNTVGTSVARALSGLRAKNPGGMVLTPLSPSSGGAAWMAAKDLLRLDPAYRFTANMSEALHSRKGNETIVLVDDNVASGTQATAQLYAYARIPKSRWPSGIRGETGVFEHAVTANELARLKAVPFAICVAVGHEVGDRRVRETALDLGFAGFQGVTYDKPIGAFTWDEELRDHLTEVGQHLISSDRFNKPLEGLSPEQRAQAEAHAFGYNGFGGLMVTTTSVPTSTVTALWMPGTVKGRPWVPLFIRRGRFSRVVFA